MQWSMLHTEKKLQWPFNLNLTIFRNKRCLLLTIHELGHSSAFLRSFMLPAEPKPSTSPKILDIQKNFTVTL